jgi:hypothetical protein
MNDTGSHARCGARPARPAPRSSGGRRQAPPHARRRRSSPKGIEPLCCGGRSTAGSGHSHEATSNCADPHLAPRVNNTTRCSTRDQRRACLTPGALSELAKVQSFVAVRLPGPRGRTLRNGPTGSDRIAESDVYVRPCRVRSSSSGRTFRRSDVSGPQSEGELTRQRRVVATGRFTALGGKKTMHFLTQPPGVTLPHNPDASAHFTWAVSGAKISYNATRAPGC